MLTRPLAQYPVKSEATNAAGIRYPKIGGDGTQEDQ